MRTTGSPKGSPAMPGSQPGSTKPDSGMERAKARPPKSAVGNKARRRGSPFRRTTQPGAPRDRKQAPPPLEKRAGLPDYREPSARLLSQSAHGAGDRPQGPRHLQMRPQPRTLPGVRLGQGAWGAASDDAPGLEKPAPKRM